MNGLTRDSGSQRSGRLVGLIALYVAALLIALFVASALIVLVTGASPLEVSEAMYRGSLGSPTAIGFTLEQAAPILIVALGSLIASRSGLFNIGPEGQFAVGASIGGLVMFQLPGPSALILPLSLIAACLGGAAWAGIAAVLKAVRGVDVVITTLLLNFVAIQVVSFAVNQTWLLKERTGGRIDAPQSPLVPESYRLPRIGSPTGLNLHTGFLFALVLAGAVWYAVSFTRWGFRLRMLGFNPLAARAAGVNLVVLGGGALVLSGAFAGLAGGVYLTATGFRVTSGVLNFGYEGLLVALICRGRVAAIIPVAIAFGALRSGGGFLGATGVPRYMVDIVQALIVLAALMPPVILDQIEHARASRGARNTARTLSTTNTAVL